MDYILLMHNDATAVVDTAGWQPYLQHLQSVGRLRGGSAIGGGTSFRRNAPPAPISDKIVGFIRIDAENMAEVEALLVDNPVYEAGGTVEVRALPKTDEPSDDRPVVKSRARR
ncbi:MAG: hypothetical protein ACR2PI_21635 [Hyphomicrobiaceae bacterium]